MTRGSWTVAGMAAALGLCCGLPTLIAAGIFTALSVSIIGGIATAAVAAIVLLVTRRRRRDRACSPDPAPPNHP